MRTSSRKNDRPESLYGGLFGIIALLLVWKLASILVSAEIILPSPEKTFTSFIALLSDPLSYRNLAWTVVRGLCGFFLAAFFALCIGIPAGIFRRLEKMIQPLLLVIRSTPVISIILLALIWFKSGSVPVFVAFLMVFPVICSNVIGGIKAVDTNLVEMTRVFRLNRRDILRWLYMPSIGGYVYTSFETAMGLTWKVIIAAEVLSRPLYAVGSKLQESRIYLETAEVFAWTMAALIVSAFFDFLLKTLFPYFFPGLSWQRIQVDR